VAERVPAPAVQQSLEVDLALSDVYDRLLTDLELSIVKTAKQHEANTFYRLRSVPGIGKLLRLVWLDEIPDIRRFPSVQACVASGRVVKCARESAGKRYSTSGSKMGHAYRTWAFPEAAVLCLRDTPAGQKQLARLEQQHGKGKAWALLAHRWARAVYYRLKCEQAFEMSKFIPG
jgi:transposase